MALKFSNFDSVSSAIAATAATRQTETINPALLASLGRIRLPEPPPMRLPPAPPPQVTPTPAPVLPVASPDNPFDSLPFPQPGDRIRADDFKTLSKALKLIADMTSLSASLFGKTFGEAKTALLAHGYQFARVMSVFGVEINDLSDASLDARKVVQVVPAELGHHELTVVVTEAVDTRRFAPNLIGLSFPQAQESIRSLVGDIPPGSGPPPPVPQLVGLGLGDAQQALSK
jgi:hypothetical protein